MTEVKDNLTIIYYHRFLCFITKVMIDWFSALNAKILTLEIVLFLQSLEFLQGANGLLNFN